MSRAREHTEHDSSSVDSTLPGSRWFIALADETALTPAEFAEHGLESVFARCPCQATNEKLVSIWHNSVAVSSRHTVSGRVRSSCTKLVP